jgi:hypothetical protein
MKIKLISEEQYNRLLTIQKEHPKLTFQNVGYSYIRKYELTDEDLKVWEEVTEILKSSILGFSEFNNFLFTKRHPDRVRIRIQYNWGADDEPQKTYFTGVGYLYANELLKGFDKEEN